MYSARIQNLSEVTENIFRVSKDLYSHKCCSFKLSIHQKILDFSLFFTKKY